jgi:hypothetical protein
MASILAVAAIVAAVTGVCCWLLNEDNKRHDKEDKR